MKSKLLIALGLPAALLCGCTVKPDLKDSDPALKIPAMKRVANQHDRAQLEQLINDLASDDSAVRFYAISTLERLTGTRNGYEYYGSEKSRDQAIARWRSWLADQTPRQAKN